MHRLKETLQVAQDIAVEVWHVVHINLGISKIPFTLIKLVSYVVCCPVTFKWY